MRNDEGNFLNLTKQVSVTYSSFLIPDYPSDRRLHGKILQILRTAGPGRSKLL